MKMPSTEHSKEWFRHYMSAINIVPFKLEGIIRDVAQYLLSVSIILYVYSLHTYNVLAGTYSVEYCSTYISV